MTIFEELRHIHSVMRANLAQFDSDATPIDEYDYADIMERIDHVITTFEATMIKDAYDVVNDHKYQIMLDSPE